MVLISSCSRHSLINIDNYLGDFRLNEKYKYKHRRQVGNAKQTIVSVETK